MTGEVDGNFGVLRDGADFWMFGDESERPPDLFAKEKRSERWIGSPPS